MSIDSCRNLRSAANAGSVMWRTEGRGSTQTCFLPYFSYVYSAVQIVCVQTALTTWHRCCRPIIISYRWWLRCWLTSSTVNNNNINNNNNHFALYFRTRPPNLCSHRRCERDFILIQRISIMLQRFDTVLLHDTLPVHLPDLWPSDVLILAFLVFSPGDLYYLGYTKKQKIIIMSLWWW